MGASPSCSYCIDQGRVEGLLKYLQGGVDTTVARQHSITILVAYEDIQEGQLVVLFLLHRELNVREDDVEMFLECQHLIPFDDHEGIIHVPGPEICNNNNPLSSSSCLFCLFLCLIFSFVIFFSTSFPPPHSPPPQSPEGQDNQRSNRPERRTALVARELAHYKVDIAALSETRFSEQGQLEGVSSAYTFFFNHMRIHESGNDRSPETPTTSNTPTCPAPHWFHRPVRPPLPPQLSPTPPTSSAHTVHAHSPLASAWSVTCESIAQRLAN
ncbi:hypothetical protein SprV_0602082200 [Sparganum proliferum]